MIIGSGIVGANMAALESAINPLAQINRYSATRYTTVGGSPNAQPPNGTDNTMRSRYPVRALVDCQNLRFKFSNHAGYDETPANSVTLAAAYWAPGASSGVRITFSGANSVVLAANQEVISDPVAGSSMSAGEYAIVEMLHTITSGEKFYPQRDFQNDILETYDASAVLQHKWGVDLADDTLTAHPGAGNAAYYGHGPEGVIAELVDPTLPRWLIIGDSIAFGAPDTVTAGYIGYCKRMFEREGYPYMRIAISGSRMDQWAVATTYDVPKLWYSQTDPSSGELITPTHVWNHGGINDLAGGRTAAQIKADLITVWRKIQTECPTAKVYQSSMFPRTTSTDNWATVANQSVAANEAERLELNNWLADGAPYHSGTFAAVAIGNTDGTTIRCNVVTVAGGVSQGTGYSASHALSGGYVSTHTLVEDLATGKWKADGTANKWCFDGIHPSGDAHFNCYANILAPGIDIAEIVANT